MQKDIYKDKLEFWELLSMAWSVYKNNFILITYICLLVYVPIWILDHFISTGIFTSSEFSVNDFTQYMRIIWWIENMLWVIASIFVILLVKKYLDWKSLVFSELLKETFSKWWRWIWWNILYSLWVWVLLLLLIIPWIIFWIYWYFFLYIIVLHDEINVSTSFEYSKNLVKWRWWEIFWYACFVLFFMFLTWLLIWLIVPNIDQFFMDLLTSLIIDFVSLFLIVFITLKFINIDSLNNSWKEVVEIVWWNNEKKDIEVNNEKVIEL